jgi:CheY-like chemotaxis protein
LHRLRDAKTLKSIKNKTGHVDAPLSVVSGDSSGTGGPGQAFVIMTEAKTPPEPVILIVEDEELLRLHAADLLEEHGFRVVEARNADAALKVLESRDDVRLLFTDIQMPGALDGLDLAREVHQRWPHVLLVITSGQKKLTEAEIPDHGRLVAKPYRAADLLGQVDEMIHKA